MRKILEELINVLTSDISIKILFGLLITIRLNTYISLNRGYTAIGGEFGVIPLYYLIKYLLKEMNEDLKTGLVENQENYDIDYSKVIVNEFNK